MQGAVERVKNTILARPYLCLSLVKFERAYDFFFYEKNDLVSFVSKIKSYFLFDVPMSTSYIRFFYLKERLKQIAQKQGVLLEHLIAIGLKNTMEELLPACEEDGFEKLKNIASLDRLISKL